MWSLFYRRGRLLILIICLIVFWGFSALNNLPRTEDPETSQRFASIVTQLPGSNADRVESLVTKEIERELAQIPEIATVRSVSQTDSSIIVVNLQARVKDVDDVWSRVRDRLSEVKAKLPPLATAPEYEEFLSVANTLIAGVTWNLDTPVNYSILSRIAEELETELSSLEGTQKVELTGKPVAEIAVEIESKRLALLGLSPQDLAQQIKASDAKVAAGQLRNISNLPLEVANVDSIEQIRQIPIRKGDRGQLATVGDVAKVTKGIKQPASELAIINGKPAVVVSALMNSDWRIDRWSMETQKVLAAFESKLSPGIGVEVIFDQSSYVQNRLNGLLVNFSIGIGCVVGTTLLMMGWRSGLIVGAALPLSVLMVFGCMQQLKIPLNQVSIIGLVIALGMAIDNAIVVVDEINLLLTRGERPKQAIAKSLSYLGVPLLASTLTTVLTFLPIVILPGNTGEFVRGIGVSVIIALVCSLLVSLTIVPALAGKISRHRAKQTRTSWWQRGISLPHITRVYRHALNLVLAKPTLGIALALTIPLMGFLAAANLELQMFPPANRDRFYVEFELPPQTAISQTETTARQARDLILATPEVVEVQLFLGSSPPEFYYNTDRSYFDRPNYAQALVRMRSPQQSRRIIRSLQTKLDRAFPDTRVLVRQLEQGDWFPAPIELRIFGSDLAILQQLGESAREILEGVADVTHTRSSLSETRPQLALEINEVRAKMVGLDRSAIAQQLDAYLEGVTGGSILEEGEELPIRVRLAQSDRANLNNLASIDLLAGSSKDTIVPLSSVARIQLKPDIAAITRYNNRRTNEVQGFVTAGVLPSKVRQEFRDRLNASGFELPPGYSIEWGGEWENLNEATANLIPIVGTLALLMVAVLVLSFASFRLAGIIAVVGVGSIGLGLASLKAFGYPLGFMSVLGTFGLIGVAINDSIVVLAALRSDPQAKMGDRLAIQQIVVRSTRHVLTTTITTVAGFVPLFFGGGEFWSPLAVTIAGGVTGSTLLALFFVPCAYLLLIKRSDRTMLPRAATRLEKIYQL